MSILEVFLLLGGIGLFLYGMHIMGDGLKAAAGDQLRVILERATRNPVLGVLLGAGVTMLIQSSGATTVMTIGFVSAGLMTLPQAASVIMGANIGTTVTSQIIAFDFGAFAPIIVFIGAVMLLFFRKKLVRNVGAIILGFGMLFMGISTMGDAIAPLKESEEFTSMLLKMNNPLLAVLIGLVFTAVLQSSSSSVGIIQAFAQQGLLDVRFAIFMVVGTSIGAWLTDYRMNYAAEILLREKHRNIAEVAAQVGYDSASKFAAAFKKVKHMTPAEYRSALR